MDHKRFNQIVEVHSLCPGNLLYNSNALAGEVGEVANIVKKIQMATMRPEWVQSNENRLPDVEHFKAMLKGELGDVFFYLHRVILDLGFDVHEIHMEQFRKLAEQTMKYNRKFLK